MAHLYFIVGTWNYKLGINHKTLPEKKYVYFHIDYMIVWAEDNVFVHSIIFLGESLSEFRKTAQTIVRRNFSSLSTVRGAPCRPVVFLSVPNLKLTKLKNFSSQEC